MSSDFWDGFSGGFWFGGMVFSWLMVFAQAILSRNARIETLEAELRKLKEE